MGSGASANVSGANGSQVYQVDAEPPQLPLIQRPKGAEPIEISQIPQSRTKNASISRMHLDDEFYTQITDEALRFLAGCDIPLLKHCSRARVKFLQYLDSDRKHEVQTLFIWLEAKINGDRDLTRRAEVYSLVLELFPLFLSGSSIYSRWLRSELGFSTSSDRMDMENIFESLYEQGVPVDTGEVFQLVRETTLAALPECGDILMPGFWFETFATAVEGLPLATFISIPDEKRGFPIVYCNKEVEILTGFSRRELHGSSTPFFFSPSEPERAEELRSALSCSLPTRMQLEITLANSQQTKVVLFTKPLYDAYARFRYVLTIMSRDASEAAMNRIECFLTTVPNVIYEEKSKRK